MIFHLFDFFRRLLPARVATPEPAPKPLRKPRAKKAAPKKAPARKKK
jgi:hypothetical protein